MKLTALFFLASSFFLFSCSSTKIGMVSFTPAEDDIIVRPIMKSFIAKNPSPKIVLRTNLEKGVKILTEEDANPIYNAIEKELARADFQVRDRKIFANILESNPSIKQYSDLKDLTDTDVILEITKKISTVGYKTNVYTNARKKEKIWKHGVVETTGILFECKFILVGTNEVAAIFAFNYVDCENGCKYSMSKDGKASKIEQKANKKTKIQTYKKDDLEVFMRLNASKMIENFK
jgi:hypothetical protein